MFSTLFTIGLVLFTVSGLLLQIAFNLGVFRKAKPIEDKSKLVIAGFATLIASIICLVLGN